MPKAKPSADFLKDYPKPGKTVPADHPPGSGAAVEAGCVCPMVDNNYGRGIKNEKGRVEWLIDRDCPVHAAPK